MGICICVLYTELYSYLLKVMEEGISAKTVTDKSYVLNVGTGMELTRAVHWKKQHPGMDRQELKPG